MPGLQGSKDAGKPGESGGTSAAHVLHQRLGLLQVAAVR